MKSIITNQTTSIQKFPCLGIYDDGDIVLFTNPQTGVVIHNPSGATHIGGYSDSWVESWEPFLGTIELSND